MNSSYPRRIHCLAERFARKSIVTSTTSFDPNITLTDTLRCLSRNSKLRKYSILKQPRMIKPHRLREAPKVYTLYNQILKTQ
jgi:hypothetical protein